MRHRPFTTTRPALVGHAVASVLAVAVALVWAPGATRAQDDWGDDGGALPVEVHGFAEGTSAARVQSDPTQSGDFVLSEARFRLDLSHFGDRAEVHFKGDFVDDDVTHTTGVDVRQAFLVMHAAHWLDIRAGRQVLTWGTGDLVFLNDMFPKDYQSFFVGRDDEFLKAPSNTIKVSAYSHAANLDVAWTPVFTPDRYITGERLSFFDPMAGAIVSAETMGGPFEALAPDETVENGEVAARLYRTVHGYELALYGYKGFTKEPLAFDPAAMRPTFSELAVYGASARGNVAGGIGNVEVAYHQSLDDAHGDDPNVPNSQVRTLVGYEREWFRNFTAGVQHYLEWIQDYDALVANAPAPQFAPGETRNTLTARLTYRAMRQTLTLSLFGFVAIEDEDFHLRPLIARQWTDAVTVAVGGNVMAGDASTFFGQLENDTNVYMRLRYSF